MIDDLLNQIAIWFTNLIKFTVDTIASFINQIVINLNALISGLIGALNTALQEIANTLRSLAATISAAFSNLLAGIQSALAQLWITLQNATVAVLNSIGNFVSDLAGKISALVLSAVDKISAFIASTVAAVQSLVNKALTAIGDATTAVVKAITSKVTDILNVAADAVQNNEDVITAEWLKLTAGADSLLKVTETKLADLAGAFKTSIKTLTDSVNSLEDTIDAAGGKAIAAVLALFNAPGDNPVIAHFMDFSNNLSAGVVTVEQFRAFLGDIGNIIAPTNKVTRTLFMGLMLAAIAVPATVEIARAYANIALQELAFVAPYNILSPADSVAAYRRLNLSFEEAVNTIRKAGFSEGDARVMVDTSAQIPPPVDVLAAWLRGLIPEESLDDALFQNGFSGQWRLMLKELAHPIPPVQDIITMAVREAFTPDIATTFGQYEDFPAEFGEWAAKVGLTEDWSKRYWAAHWSLPGADQGFEMLHRGIVTPEELDKLLRALDIMPFWRDKLVQIAYYPFTRIDIRRMHKLGVLDEPAVLRAHKDLGYNDEKAALLTQFVLKLNKGTGAQDDAELGKLSRATVLGFYRDGLLTAERAEQLLVEAGNTAEAATLYVEEVALANERDLRKTEIALVVDTFKAGALTYEEAVDSLNRLGLASAEVGKAVDQLVRAQKTANKLPSKGDGDAFLSAGIITEAQYLDLLKRLGYSAEWSAAYLTLQKKGG